TSASLQARIAIAELLLTRSSSLRVLAGSIETRSGPPPPRPGPAGRSPWHRRTSPCCCSPPRAGRRTPARSSWTRACWCCPAPPRGRTTWASWWTRCCSATGACGTSSSRVASRGASASPPRPIRCRTRRAGAGLGAARPQLSAGRSALVALEARDGAVDGAGALRGGGFHGLAVVVEGHQRELAGVDVDQRELVVLHGEHGVADGAGRAVAAHDLGGEGGVLAVQRDRDDAVLLARGVG